MATGPIPYTAIMTYCDHHGFPDDLRSLVDTVIGAMDGAYLKWLAAEQKRRADG